MLISVIFNSPYPKIRRGLIRIKNQKDLPFYFYSFSFDFKSNSPEYQKIYDSFKDIDPRRNHFKSLTFENYILKKVNEQTVKSDIQLDLLNIIPMHSMLESNLVNQRWTYVTNDKINDFEFWIDGKMIWKVKIPLCYINYAAEYPEIICDQSRIISFVDGDPWYFLSPDELITREILLYDVYGRLYLYMSVNAPTYCYSHIINSLLFSLIEINAKERLYLKIGKKINPKKIKN